MGPNQGQFSPARGAPAIGLRSNAALAHDPAKWNRFAVKIMRQINKLARDRTQNRYPLLLIAR